MNADDSSIPVYWDDADETVRTPFRGRRPIWPWVALVCTPLFAAGAAALWPGDSPVVSPEPALALAPAPEPAPAPAPLVVPAPDVTPAPAPVPAPEPPPPPAAPVVERTGRTTTVVVPITGDIAGARHYLLADPDGVAINVPHARAAVPDGDYSIQDNGVTVLWVHERQGGTHVRVYFSSRTSGHALTIDPDAVRVTLDLAW